MAKKKKLLSIPALSPQKYIQTKARSLPIYKCFISRNWEETGMANVLISRKHVNGNLTWAIYLVDLLCLGVKDTIFIFNEPGFKFYEQLEDYFSDEDEQEEVDYTLVHNIIYGAIEFAEENGFLPHKGFNITRYLLEEDDDHIELMDIEFGNEGTPVVFVSHEKPNFHIIAQLEKSVGKGNFIIENVENDFYDDEDDDIEELDSFEDLTDEDLEAVQRGEKKLNPEILNKWINEAYKEKIGLRDLSEEEIANYVGLDKVKITSSPLVDRSHFTSEEERDEAQRIFLMLDEEDPKELKKIISILEKNIEIYPQNPIYYNYLVGTYTKIAEKEKAYKILNQLIEKFPNYSFGKFNYAEVLFIEGRFDEIPSLFNNRFDLKGLDPEREEFHITELQNFSAVMMLYFSEKEDMAHAQIYYEVIQKTFNVKQYTQHFVSLALMKFIAKKLEVLVEKSPQVN